MGIDRSAALAAAPSVREVSWTERDVLLYHLGIGAGGHPMDQDELTWVYEKNLRVLPTFAMVAGQGVSAGTIRPPGMNLPGIDIDLRKILHGGQSLTMHGPIPASGSAVLSSRVADVWDKGKAAVIVLEQAAADPDGNPLWTSEMQIWARGAGGFGGPSGPDASACAPDREPAEVLTSRTTPSQALVYRLSGDMNPLHADPDFAARAGFDRPVLHGLATYGLVCKAVVDSILDGDAGAVQTFSARFAGSIYPGETIETSVWREDNRLILHAVCPDREGQALLTHAHMEIR